MLGKKAAILCLMVLVLACSAMARTNDVPRSHWAYGAVQELADKGLVLGYPDGNFLGDRAITRYEMASIVKRIVDRLETLCAGQPVPQAAPQAVLPPGISKDDLNTVSQLVEEYKVELAVMGTRLDNVEKMLAEQGVSLENISTTVDKLNAICTDEEGALESTRADVSKLKKVTVGGYVQARYQTIDFSKEDTSEESQEDTFLVRRARIKATGNPTAKSKAVVQIEAAKNSVSVKDAYIQYMFKGGEALGSSFYLGQMNWPFGYIVPLSSSTRLAPERPLIARRLFPGERDQGAKLTGATDKPWYWQIGVFNGTGTEKSSASDLNEAKDVVLNLRRSFGDSLEGGLSYYDGRGVWTTFGTSSTYRSDVDRVRYGADMQYYGNGYTLEAEYMRGKGVDEANSSWDQNEFVDGYYAQLAVNVNPADMLVARYSSLSADPKNPTFGRRNGWDLGVVRTLDEKTRVKLFYVINNEESNGIKNNGLTFEWLTKY
ncbi:MAG: S-layer homology domain-containing protein [Armatimonadota bacterium]